jgi:SAM-dependent methyltransferase
MRRWGLISAIIVVALALLTAISFPYAVDKPLSAEEVEKTQKHWTEMYLTGVDSKEGRPAPNLQDAFVELHAQVKNQVSDFVARYGLEKGTILEIGSGSGYLQDVVANYTGIDIAQSVTSLYHKKFVLGSATAMPFADNSFDGGWSIYVYEHVPNPEQALAETRRVMKNGAVLYLMPAWNVTPWAAEGYDVRPYSGLDWKGKIIKATIPLRASRAFRAVTVAPSRRLRSIASWTGPTRFHYHLLEPNYHHYWEQDSDALNSFDQYEFFLWFSSRGDRCLNCTGLNNSWKRGMPAALVIRIQKVS